MGKKRRRNPSRARVRQARVCEKCGGEFVFEAFPYARDDPRLGRYCSRGCQKADRSPDGLAHLADYRAEADAARADAIAHYSDGANRCAECGEFDMAELTVGVIPGAVATIAAGNGYYQRLAAAGWPGGYRVVCKDCRRREAWRPQQKTPAAGMATGVG